MLIFRIAMRRRDIEFNDFKSSPCGEKGFASNIHSHPKNLWDHCALLYVLVAQPFEGLLACLQLPVELHFPRFS